MNPKLLPDNVESMDDLFKAVEGLTLDQMRAEAFAAACAEAQAYWTIARRALLRCRCSVGQDKDAAVENAEKRCDECKADLLTAQRMIQNMLVFRAVCNHWQKVNAHKNAGADVLTEEQKKMLVAGTRTVQ